MPGDEIPRRLPHRARALGDGANTANLIGVFGDIGFVEESQAQLADKLVTWMFVFQHPHQFNVGVQIARAVHADAARCDAGLRQAVCPQANLGFRAVALGLLHQFRPAQVKPGIDRQPTFRRFLDLHGVDNHERRFAALFHHQTAGDVRAVGQVSARRVAAMPSGDDKGIQVALCH